LVETLARFEKDVKRTDTGFLAIATEVEDGKEKISEPPGKIKELLKEFQDILPDDLPNELPPYRTHQHEIVEEPGSKPTFRAPYRLSPTELTDMKKQIEYLLAKGLIRPSTSPYGAPVLFTRNRTEACACVSTTELLTSRPSRTSIRYHESMTCLTSFGELRYFPNWICGPDTGRYGWRTTLSTKLLSELGTDRTSIWINENWVPNYPPLRQLLLEEYHDVLYAGHFGSNKTLTGIAKHYYWPHLADDVQKFVTSCDTCQRMKSSKQKKAGLLQPLPVPEQPWQVVSLDFITGLPPTTSGHDAILVVIDKFSKMGHFIPTHTTARTEQTAQLFVRHIISQHGIPTTLISDRDPKFTSKFWKELMSLLGTKLAMSSAYHPQTDGQTERLNQIVEQLLRAACKDEISKWDLHLPVLEFAYNNATHAATGQTPFFLCYGRHPLTPQKPPTPATVQPAHDFITTMHQLWDRTHKRLLDIQQQQKRQADRHRNDHTITVGTRCFSTPVNLDISHLPSKLRPRFCGPFLVEAQI
ncbi:hypothetical protein CLOM_g9113, partial [Closterium sp. NIES-68]